MKWLYSVTTSVVLASSVLLSGCGDDSTSDACAYGVQQNLDQGNFDSVIAVLDNNGTCGGQFTQDEAWLNLAAAYMGKAGLTMSNLLGAVMDSSGTDAMSSFMVSFAEAADAEGLANLARAKEVYAYIDPSCSGSEVSTAAEACLYSGLSTLTETVGSLGAIVGAENLTLINATSLSAADDTDGDGTADQIEITACAIQDAQNALAGCAADPTAVDCTVAAPTIDGQAYDCRYYTLNTNDAYKLISGTSVVTTDGVCAKDGYTGTCTEADGSNCFPCPVVVNGTTTTVTSGLLSIINNPTAFDSLSAFLPADDTGTSADIQGELIDSIEGIGGNNNITEAELANFLLGL